MCPYGFSPGVFRPRRPHGARILHASRHQPLVTYSVTNNARAASQKLQPQTATAWRARLPPSRGGHGGPPSNKLPCLEGAAPPLPSATVLPRPELVSTVCNVFRYKQRERHLAVCRTASGTPPFVAPQPRPEKCSPIHKTGRRMGRDLSRCRRPRTGLSEAGYNARVVSAPIRVRRAAAGMRWRRAPRSA